MSEPTCRKCGGAMKPGQAMEQTFDCGDEGTCTPAGPGRLVDCLKCERCGWSVTPSGAWWKDPRNYEMAPYTP